MPRTMPAALTAEKNKLNQTGVWLWLIDLTTKDGSTTVRYVNNTENITYGGYTYTAFNFTIDPVETGTEGELAALTVTISDIGLALQDIIRANNGLRGASLTLTYVNSALLASDYSEDAVTFEVLHCQNLYWDVVLHLGVPSTLNGRVPPDRFLALQCRHPFRIPSGEYSLRCGYVGKSVTVTKTAGQPVKLTAAAHGFLTGDKVRVYDVTGLTPALNGDYTITKVDANNFTLDGTNGSNYSGTAGGIPKAGYAVCNRNFTSCRNHARNTSYGGTAASRGEALRLAF
jgi:phage-related protein